jgi:hypothetical protein
MIMRKLSRLVLLAIIVLTLLSVFGALVSVRAASNQAPDVVINEVVINPPGADSPYEYIELRGPPGASLNNVNLVVVEGDPQGMIASPGTFDHVVNLNGRTLGSNGLLILVPPNAPWKSSIPTQTTVVDYPRLDVPADVNMAGGIENGANSFLLLHTPQVLNETVDYDVDNNGTLELLPADTVLMDGIGYMRVNSINVASGIVYGLVELTQPNGEMDAATRFRNSTAPNFQASWYNGDLTNTIDYDENKVSLNFPAGGRLSPGAPNLPAPAPTTTPTVAPTLTPRPTNTPVPGTPGGPTNTPVPLDTLTPTATRAPLNNRMYLPTLWRT